MTGCRVPDARPMLATPGPLPVGDGWSYEVKYDGIRALVGVDNTHAVTITSRAGNDVSATFPELHAIGEALHGSTATLDGEIIAVGDNGLPSFHRLQERLGVFGTDAHRRAATNPVVLMVFDIVELNGLPTTEVPLGARRILLD